ncbi:RSLBA protein, partial [Quiscalus mexicanus]|nr:RSLBA protein [Quiscalus mexicanus]
STGNLYSRLVHLDGDHVAVQIQDTPGCIQVQEDCVQVLDSLSRCVKWAEGFLLVYSITDYSSYQSVQPLYQHIRKVHPDARTPIIIVGNKADLLHARQVQAKEGLQLADELGSLFLEISTSEDSQGVCDVFQYLCKEVSKLQHAGSMDRRRSSIIPRPKSPNMQDLKRRFKQALSSKVK